MTELTYEVPTVGEKHQASDQRVSTALTEIKSVLNGRLTANNFAKETITPKKFKPGEKWGALAQLTEKNLISGEKVEKTVSETTAIFINIVQPTEVSNTVVVKVGGNQIATVTAPTLGAGKTYTTPIGPFRVPGGETWLVEVTAGTMFSSEFSQEKVIA